MTSTSQKGQKHQDFLRRQKLKGNSVAFMFAGFTICHQVTIFDGLHALPYWLGVAGGLALISYGLITYWPVRREEKEEMEAWKKEEQAEIEAANVFLFGTTQNRK